MRWFLVASLILVFSGQAWAQTSIAVDIDKATIVWDAWAVGQGSKPDTYHVKCGDSTGNYNHPQVNVPSDRNSTPVKSAIPGIGAYFCVVTASNQFGQSGPSNEINFEAGSKPDNPTGTHLEAS